MQSLQATNLVSQGNKFRATFNIAFQTILGGNFNLVSSYSKVTKYSSKYLINKLNFEVRAIISKDNSVLSSPFNIPSAFQCLLFVKFTKDQNDDANYSMYLSSKSLQMNKKFLSDDSEWRLIYETNREQFVFDVEIQVEAVDCLNASARGSFANFATLHDDTELTDFELRGTDGSVSIHSAVLAVFSPALRRMLEGKWEETKNRVLEIPETSRVTLQHLKDYMYVGVMPEDGVKHLLLLASCYLMEDLKIKCIQQIISRLNAQNAVEISKFALANNIMELYFALLDRIRSESVKVDDIRECNK